ncbi:ABC transporter substrate-binding protein [Grimontia hollisae]|uniref:Dipeptide-binding ABC transporter substrate-binding component n=2 Tax=Grimontia hollisae TaxID=673 RepID=D0I4E1_GRIHO|nr:ABC transporter substrate-binding protein [Grimontia hollisae]AMG30568.1 ABC transporter substrate-binding protein [Grimontia hollisae]EEY73919.1 dipeptide-binding ABC transporter substrate-binding component [Grimontia hollisae CIP 101886]STO41819.1 Dipeptide-binding protein [Grimontia hollisae]STO55744.1 Dipeptide-binding protein [Grimontia hollisae]
MKTGMLKLSAALLASAMTAGVQAKTLVYCSEGSPEGFNPSLYTAGTTFDASSRQIFNRLVQFERGTTNIVPGLAESWTVSDDGLSYTFKLREGVKFHTTKNFKPTRDFNADDVIFSFMRQKDENHPYHKVSGGSYEYFNAMEMGGLIDTIEKVDDYTITFTLTRPEAPFIANLAMDFASIMSAEQADQMLKAGSPEKLDFEPVGTGPFVLAGYKKDSTIRYLAHPDYFEGKAPIDRLVFSITPDASVRYAKLQKGECHVMPYPNPADLDRMRSDEVVNLMNQEGLNVGYLGFNTQKKPYDDVRVRQALNMAVNKAAIIDAVFQGAGKAAKNPIPPTIWSYNDAVVDYEYDLEKAKALLKDAGLEKGFKTNIWAMPVQRPYNPNARRMAEVIQADWAKIGVEAEIVTFEWGEYLKRSKAGEHDTVLLGWTGDNGDPDNFLAVLLGCSGVGGSNRAQWCYEPFEDLIQKAKKTSNVDERTKLYQQAQAVFKEQAPWVTIAHSVVFEPVRKEVKDYKIDPFGGHIFYGVDIQE